MIEAQSIDVAIGRRSNYMTDPTPARPEQAPPITRLFRIGYATGTMSFMVKDVAFGSFVLFYYTSVVGLSGTLAGAVLFIGLAWDAVSDPIIGSISDNFRSRWGRRLPFMAVSGIPLAICMYLLFNVPEGLGQTGIFVWMLSVMIALRTFITMYGLPYLALGAELSEDYEERSNIAGTRTLLGWMTGILLTAFAWAFIFAETPDGDGRLVRENYVMFGVIAFSIVAIFTTVCTFVVRGRLAYLPQAAEGARVNMGKLYRDLVLAFQNSNFRNLFFLMLTLGVPTGLNAALGTHMNTYFWELTTEQLALVTFTVVGAIVVMTGVMGKLNERIEKQTAIKLCILGIVVNSLWFVPMRLLGLFPENHTLLLFVFVSMHAMIASAIIIWFQTVSSSVIADITDEQEYVTHQRQEGVFFAAQGFSIKFVTGIGNLLGGVVIDMIKLPVGAEPGTVDAQVIFELGVVMGPGMILVLAVPYYFSRKLTLSRARHAEVREELERRQVESAAL